MPDSLYRPFDRAACVLLLAVGAWWGLRVVLPAPLGEHAPAGVFSAERALRHVRATCAKPHPAGSAEAAEVRDYIRAELTRLGIPNEIERGAGLYQRGSWIMAGNAENVVGTIHGTQHGGPAVLLSCHYDSVPLGPGAADDGAGVGVVLETARALKTGTPPRNDVLLLFDVEETGMTGADAFARTERWRNTQIFDINVEARGTTGPAFMFQTSAHNAPLMDAYAQAVPHPQANSLTYEIYKRLPNDTDMSVFRRYGYAGYDIAFIDNVLAYHTPHDDVAHLSAETVQHEGESMLALARRLSQEPALIALRFSNDDATYFSAGGFFFHYRMMTVFWALPVLLVLLPLSRLIRRLRKTGVVTIRGLLAGALACLAVAVVSGPVVAKLLWRLLRVIHSDYGAFPQQDLYHRDWYIAAFFALTLALFFTALRLARRWASTESFVAGGLLLVGLLCFGLAIYLPGGTYFLLWPLVGGLLALWAGTRRAALGALLAVPALWLMLPFARYAFVGLSMRAADVCCILFALMLTCIALPLAALAEGSEWRWTLGCAAVALAALIGGGFANRLDAAHPLEDNMNYVVDADTHQGWWASQSTQLDPWLKQFLGEHPERAENSYGTHFDVLRHPAPALDLPAPEVTVTSDRTERGVRDVEVQIVSRRGALAYLVQALDGVLKGSVEGLDWSRAQATTDRPGWSGATMIYYSCPGPDGARLGFTVPAGAKLRFRIFEPVQGLPHGPGLTWAGRGPGLLAMLARPFSDETIVIKGYEF